MVLQGILFYFIAAFILFYFILHVRPALLKMRAMSGNSLQLQNGFNSRSITLSLIWSKSTKLHLLEVPLKHCSEAFCTLQLHVV